MARICSGRSLSHKKGQNNAVYSNRDGPRDSHYASEKEKGKYHDIACKWKLEHNAEELITKQKTLREPTCGHQEGGMVAEGWPGGLGLLCTGWTNSMVLPKGAGNCILHPVINRNRKKTTRL